MARRSSATHADEALPPPAAGSRAAGRSPCSATTVAALALRRQHRCSSMGCMHDAKYIGMPAGLAIGLG